MKRRHNMTSRRHATFEPLERRQLMSGGQYDPTFGNGGAALSSFGFIANDIAVQNDGKIVLVGSINGDFAVARLNIDGSPDKSFGLGSGLATTDFAGEQSDVADKVAILPDGRILVAGRKIKGTAGGGSVSGQFVVARYLSDGKLDLGFSGDGRTSLFDRMDIGAVGGLAIQPDGKIVLTGGHYQPHLLSTNPGMHFDVRTARLLPSGELDKTFGLRFGSGTVGTGYIEADFAGQDEPRGLVIQPDGKVVVGVSHYRDGKYSFAMVRYNVAGLFDSSFDGDGKLSTKLNGKIPLAGIALQPDGKLVAAGGFNGQIALSRYNANGSADKTFGDAGVSFTLDGGSYTVNSVFALPTGKILVTGSRPGAPIVAQFNSNGWLDESFATKGIATIFNAPMQTKVGARMVDGRVVIAGGSGTSTALVRVINAPVQVGIYPWVESAAETTGAARNGAIIVARDAVYSFATRVYFTLGGNATVWSDYRSDFSLLTPTRGYVDIKAGQSFVMLPITVLNSDAVEPTEVATFALAEDPGYSGGKSVFASVTIADDDALEVNFQPSSTNYSAGWAKDFGNVFGARDGGLSFGWDADNTANARVRDNPRSPHFMYDSLNHMQKNGANRKWEIALQNGLYQVTIVAGDPSNTDSVYKMNLENVPAINGTPAGNTRWFSSTLNVWVYDGRLTLTNAAGAVNNRICVIDIKAAAPGAKAGAIELNRPIGLRTGPPPGPLFRRLFADKPMTTDDRDTPLI